MIISVDFKKYQKVLQDEKNDIRRNLINMK